VPISPVMRPVVIVPTYNERANIAELVPALLAIEGLRIIVADDGSPDGTGATADRLAEDSLGRLRVLHRTGPRGYGRSHLDGMRMALSRRHLVAWLAAQPLAAFAQARAWPASVRHPSGPLHPDVMEV